MRTVASFAEGRSDFLSGTLRNALASRGVPVRRHRGFTLIEVVITVAIVSILVAIALPNYSAYVMRSKITEATGNLSDMRNRMEQYFFDHREFPGACIAAAPGAAPDKKIYLPETMTHFDVTCAFPSATSYTVTATGKATSGTAGFAYTIDEANNRRTTGLPSGWTGSGNNCWVTKKDGTC
jgi:type IV pilus assembly protein PilE